MLQITQVFTLKYLNRFKDLNPTALEDPRDRNIEVVLRFEGHNISLGGK